MDIMKNEIERIEGELSKSGEYIEQCYVCCGFFLGKFAGNKRIVREPSVIITAINEATKEKSTVKIDSGEYSEVYLCEMCENRLKGGQIVFNDGE